MMCYLPAMVLCVWSVWRQTGCMRMHSCPYCLSRPLSSSTGSAKSGPEWRGNNPFGKLGLIQKVRLLLPQSSFHPSTRQCRPMTSFVRYTENSEAYKVKGVDRLYSLARSSAPHASRHERLSWSNPSLHSPTLCSRGIRDNMLHAMQDRAVLSKGPPDFRESRHNSGCAHAH